MRRLAIILFIVGSILIILGFLLENPNCSQTPIVLPETSTVDEVYQQLQNNVDPVDPINAIGDMSSSPATIQQHIPYPQPHPSYNKTQYNYQEEFHEEDQEQTMTETVVEQEYPYQQHQMEETVVEQEYPYQQHQMEDTPDAEVYQQEHHDKYPYLSPDHRGVFYTEYEDHASGKPPHVYGKSKPYSHNTISGHPLFHPHQISPKVKHSNPGRFIPSKNNLAPRKPIPTSLGKDKINHDPTQRQTPQYPTQRQTPQYPTPKPPPTSAPNTPQSTMSSTMDRISKSLPTELSAAIHKYIPTT